MVSPTDSQSIFPKNAVIEVMIFFPTSFQSIASTVSLMKSKSALKASPAVLPKFSHSIPFSESDMAFPIFLPSSSHFTVVIRVYIVLINVLINLEAAFDMASQFIFSTKEFIASPRPFAPVTKVS